MFPRLRKLLVGGCYRQILLVLQNAFLKLRFMANISQAELLRQILPLRQLKIGDLAGEGMLSAVVPITHLNPDLAYFIQVCYPYEHTTL